MSKLNTSVSVTCSRQIALLFLFIVYVSAKNVDSYQYDDDNGQFNLRLTPDMLFMLKNINSYSGPSTPISDYDLQYDQGRGTPFKKRIIPIELQKALYAHGIVGRRR